MKKKILVSTIIFIILISIIAIILIFRNTDNQNIKEIKIQEFFSKKTTLMFVGDIMLTRGVESSVNKNFNGDYNKLFENLSYLKNADILFANLEGPVSDKGNNVGSKYSFRMNPSVLNAISNFGIDIVSFANNHIGDWNTEAFNDTIYRLRENNILNTGAGLNKTEVIEPTIIKKNGINFGFLGFSDVGPKWMEAKDNNPGILLADDPNFEEIIRNAKAKTDILIISFHFGDEYKKVHNKRQEYLAHMAIDSGADMIIGHHPHVPQDIEIYKDKIIVYSLGNFIFDQHFSTDTMRGMMFEITFEDKNIIETKTKFIPLNKFYQPEGIFTKEELRERDEVNSNVCPKPEKEFENMWLLNIGQTVSLSDKNYIPKDLREINTESSTKRGICLIKEARDSLEKMIEEAKSDGLTMKVSSGFRNYEYQKMLMDNAIKNGNKNANIAIAKAGHSEHQLGTAIDITGKSINYTGASSVFADTEESKWLEQNAVNFGFIKSYPLGKEEITGYMYEPWHYRYVGIENAKKIFEAGETISEFLQKE